MTHDMAKALAEFPLKYVPFLFSLCFHEVAHGVVAKLKGDMTASMMGRLTMNPLAHADLVGTLIFPAIGMITGVPVFGWAKPVPVNSRNLKHPIKDMFWIAAAGPLSNLFLSVVGILVLGLIGTQSAVDFSARTSDALSKMMVFFVQINVVLAVFNLIPLHPLDGGKILARFIPNSWNNALENNQHMTTWILLALAFTGGLYMILNPFIGLILHGLSWIAMKVFGG